MIPTIDVVVVLPCVPATASVYFNRETSESISARRSSGTPSFIAASVSGFLSILTALVTWLTSPNFMDKMKAEVKTVADISPFMEKNMTKIATEQGFKSTKEANDLFKKFANDADVKKLMQETEKKVTPRLEELMKFQLELMKQEESNNSGVQPGDTTMMTEQTDAPQPAPEAKK